MFEAELEVTEQEWVWAEFANDKPEPVITNEVDAPPVELVTE